MSKEAEDFFKGNVKHEENNGGTSVGSKCDQIDGLIQLMDTIFYDTIRYD